MFIPQILIPSKQLPENVVSDISTTSSVEEKTEQLNISVDKMVSEVGSLMLSQKIHHL